MATITSKHKIKEMIQSGGSYRGDPVPIAVYEYIGQSGVKVFSVCYRQVDIDNLVSSSYIVDEKVIWSQDTGWLLDETVEEYFESSETEKIKI